jgi:hypothetical protein
MGIASEGTFSTRFTHPCPIYQRHVPGSAGLGVSTCHAPDAHMTSWFSGTSAGGEGACCQPSVPSVSVLGIDPFFVQYCMAYLYRVGKAAVGRASVFVPLKTI